MPGRQPDRATWYAVEPKGQAMFEFECPLCAVSSTGRCNAILIKWEDEVAERAQHSLLVIY